MNKICEGCVHCDDCWILNPKECGEYMSLDEYIEKQREEFTDTYLYYINSFENE